MKWALSTCAPLAAATLLATALAAQAPQPAPAPKAAPKQQFTWPETLRNPQVLPRDIGSQQLRATMMGFVTGLGVRCTYCHVGAEEVPLAERDFASDANPHKQIAREMMRMVQHLNQERLPAISGLTEPRVTCYTCHRGATEPATAPPPPPPAQ